MNDDDRSTLPLYEETLRVDTRPILKSRVRVRTETDLFEAIASANLNGEEVEVVRVPIGHEVDTRPEMRTEGEVTIIPVVEEVLVVETRLVLKEEIHIRRRLTEETVEIPVALRRQRAVVERIDPATGDVTTETISLSKDATND